VEQKGHILLQKTERIIVGIIDIRRKIMKKELAEAKEKIYSKARIEYEKEWLKITGYKIGDIVSAHFSTSHGTYKQSFMSSCDCDAELKLNEKGFIDVVSTKELEDSYHTDNGRNPSSRSYRSWWAYRHIIMTVSIDKVNLEEKC